MNNFDAEAHWKTVLDTPGLATIAYEMAREYLGKRHAPQAINPVAFTTPLEDEETEAAFAAYLAESAQIESELAPE